MTVARLRPLVPGALVLAMALPSGLARGAKDPAPPATQLQTLVDALRGDDYFKVRLQAAMLLGRSDDDRAYEPLVEALAADPHYTVRAAAATALANLQQPRAIGAILDAAATDSEDFVREEAERAVQKFVRAEAMPYVLAAYNNADARVRRAVLEYVTVEPTPDAEPMLVRGLGDEAEEVRALAKKSVLALPAPARRALLQDALDNREASVRSGAVRVLTDESSPEAAELVLRVYEADVEVDDVREAAREGLRKLSAHLPMDDIMRRAVNDSDKHVRAKALKLLGVVGGAKAEEVLLAALRDDNPYIRGNAVMAIGELGNPDLLPPLERMLSDPDNQRILNLVRHHIKQLRKKRGDEAL